MPNYRRLIGLTSLSITSLNNLAAANSNEHLELPSSRQASTPLETVSEVALGNMIIYSQEYMKYFFADADSSIQPLPASGISLFGTYGLSERTRWISAITIPLREEEVKKKNEETFRYYYPKLLLVGLEFDWLESNVFENSSILRISCSAGVSFPLSYRIMNYIPPFLLNRAAIRIAKNVDLNFGIGYSGNIRTGAWFFPFGVSYRMNSEH